MNTKALVFAGSALLFFLFVFGYMLLLTKKKSYNPLREYPAELLPLKKSSSILFFVVIAFIVATSILTFIFGFNSYGNIATSIGAFLLAFSTLLVLPLSVFNDQNRRTHTAISYLFFGASGIASCMIGLAGLIETQFINHPKFPIPLAIIIMVIGFVELLLLLNPRIWKPIFLKWEDDGKVTYIRPKLHFLAIYEWIYFFFIFLQVVAVFVVSFSMSTAM